VVFAKCPEYDGERLWAEWHGEWKCQCHGGEITECFGSAEHVWEYAAAVLIVCGGKDVVKIFTVLLRFC